ncbi:MAG: right-handed parallel beta-helix repeat-containing protein [Spirochaetaceae bacterium]|nr:right-handed parallel beta-helix repeat-containing protein [Spirochaetaceae bacterium]
MKRMILIALLICICGQVFAQSVIYVSAGGNDDNNGQTEATAYKSLDMAAIMAALTGAKIIVIGTLTTANATLYERGNSIIFKLVSMDDQELIITGKPGATGSDRAVLSGRGADAKVGCIVGTAKDSNIRFENIEISGLTDETTAGIYVDDGGSVTLGPGAVVRGNGGFGITVINGTCVINGGEVRDSGRTGIVVSDKGALTMRSGAVSGNKLSGVFVFEGGRFTMSGGTITGNSNPKAGGGVIVDSGGRFDQTGGTVSGNTAPLFPNIFKVNG